MKTLSFLAVIAATATPALADFNQDIIASKNLTSVSADFSGGTVDNNPR